MPNIKLLCSSIAIAGLLTATAAEAKATRAAGSLPAPKAGFAGVSSKSDSFRSGRRGRDPKSLPTHVGPKKGWKYNRGLENAWEHSNEHSAHHRHDRDDSPGC